MGRSQRQPAVFWDVAGGPGDKRRGWRRRWGTRTPSVSGSGHGKRDILGAAGSPEGLGRRVTLPDTPALACGEQTGARAEEGGGAPALPSCPQMWKPRLAGGWGRAGLGLVHRPSAQGACPSPAGSGRLRRAELGPSRGGFQAPQLPAPASERGLIWMQPLCRWLEPREGARGAIVVGPRWALHPVAGVLTRGRTGRFQTDARRGQGRAKEEAEVRARRS